MYNTKYIFTELQLEEFIKEANENNYELISSTEFKGKLTIIYKDDAEETIGIKPRQSKKIKGKVSKVSRTDGKIEEVEKEEDN